MSHREPYKRQGDGMDLPQGKTCGDCVHCRRCCAIYGHIQEDEVCDFLPSRFKEKQAKEAAP